jgi:hypothetical protein
MLNNIVVIYYWAGQGNIARRMTAYLSLLTSHSHMLLILCIFFTPSGLQEMPQIYTSELRCY